MNVKNFHGKSVIDSREVAEMVERSHSELLKSIRIYADYLAEGEIPLGDFFIESTYLDSNNQSRPNFLITKKGCDMIANKITGKKGVLFTAAYVTTFEDMKKTIDNTRFHRIPQVSPNGLARLMEVHRQAIIDAGGTPDDVMKMIADLDRTWGIPVPSPLENQVSGQLYLFNAPALPPESGKPKM